LARYVTKKLDVNDYSLAHLALILLLHYLVKFSTSSFGCLQQRIHTVERMRRLRND